MIKFIVRRSGETAFRVYDYAPQLDLRAILPVGGYEVGVADLAPGLIHVLESDVVAPAIVRTAPGVWQSIPDGYNLATASARYTKGSYRRGDVAVPPSEVAVAFSPASGLAGAGEEVFAVETVDGQAFPPVSVIVGAPSASAPAAYSAALLGNPPLVALTTATGDRARLVIAGEPDFRGATPAPSEVSFDGGASWASLPGARVGEHVLTLPDAGAPNVVLLRARSAEGGPGPSYQAGLVTPLYTLDWITPPSLGAIEEGGSIGAALDLGVAHRGDGFPATVTASVLAPAGADLFGARAAGDAVRVRVRAEVDGAAPIARDLGPVTVSAAAQAPTITLATLGALGPLVAGTRADAGVTRPTFAVADPANPEAVPSVAEQWTPAADTILADGQAVSVRFVATYPGAEAVETTLTGTAEAPTVSTLAPVRAPSLGGLARGDRYDLGLDLGAYEDDAGTPGTILSHRIEASGGVVAGDGIAGVDEEVTLIVTVRDSAGLDRDFASETVTVAPVLPAAFTAATVTVSDHPSPTGDQIDVTIVSPLPDNGGRSYVAVHARVDAGGLSTASTLSFPLLDSGRNGQPHRLVSPAPEQPATVTLWVETSRGEGPEWTSASVTPSVSTGATAPAAPVAPVVLATGPASASVDLASDPADGGSPITRRDIAWSLDGGPETEVLDVSDPHPLTGLRSTVSATALLSVRARVANVIDPGPWSLPRTVTLPAQTTEPDAPGDLVTTSTATPSLDGITPTLSRAAPVGTAINGHRWIITGGTPITVQAIDPPPSGTLGDYRGGAQLNPGNAKLAFPDADTSTLAKRQAVNHRGPRVQGYTGFKADKSAQNYEDYAARLNVHPTASGPLTLTEGSLVVARKKASSDNSQPERFVPFHFVRQAPFADSIPRGYAGTNKTPRVRMSHIDLSRFPRRADPGGGTWPSYEAITHMLKVRFTDQEPYQVQALNTWPTGGATAFNNEVLDYEFQIGGYPREWAAVEAIALLWVIYGGGTDAQRRMVIALIMCQAEVTMDRAEQGLVLLANGGHNIGRLLRVLVYALATGHPDAIAVARMNVVGPVDPPGSKVVQQGTSIWGELQQLTRVTQALINARAGDRYFYPQAALGAPEFGNDVGQEALSPLNLLGNLHSGKDPAGRDLKPGYRHQNFKTYGPLRVLFHVLPSFGAILGEDKARLFCDYADRHWDYLVNGRYYDTNAGATNVYQHPPAPMAEEAWKRDVPQSARWTMDNTNPIRDWGDVPSNTTTSGGSSGGGTTPEPEPTPTPTAPAIGDLSMMVLAQSEPSYMFRNASFHSSGGAYPVPYPPVLASKARVVINADNSKSGALADFAITQANRDAGNLNPHMIAVANMWGRIAPNNTLTMGDGTRSGTHPSALFDDQNTDRSMATVQAVLDRIVALTGAPPKVTVWDWYNSTAGGWANFREEFGKFILGVNPDGTPIDLVTAAQDHCWFDATVADNEIGRGKVARSASRFALMLPGISPNSGMAQRLNFTHGLDGSGPQGRNAQLARPTDDAGRAFVRDAQLGAARPVSLDLVSPYICLYGEPNYGTTGGATEIHPSVKTPYGTYYHMHRLVGAMAAMGWAGVPKIIGQRHAADRLSTDIYISLPNGGVLSTARKIKGIASPEASLADHQQADGTGFELRLPGNTDAQIQPIYRRNATSRPAAYRGDVAILNAGENVTGGRRAVVRITWQQAVPDGAVIQFIRHGDRTAQTVGLDHKRYLWADMLLEHVSLWDAGGDFGYPGVPIVPQTPEALLTLQAGTLVGADVAPVGQFASEGGGTPPVPAATVTAVSTAPLTDTTARSTTTVDGPGRIAGVVLLGDAPTSSKETVAAGQGPGGSLMGEPRRFAFDVTAAGTYTVDTSGTAAGGSYQTRAVITDAAGLISPVAVSPVWVSTAPAAGSDTTAPGTSARTPESNSTGAATAITPTWTLNEPVKKGTGTATLLRLDGGAYVTVRSFAQADVSVSGSTVTFPALTLAAGTSYRITIPAGFVTDLAGNPHGGIGSWDFATQAAAGGGTTPLATSTNGGAASFSGAVPSTSTSGGAASFTGA